MKFHRRSTESKKTGSWGIGVLAGKALHNLAEVSGIINPVLRAKDITDCRAGFIADPFGFLRGGHWYLFFEVFDIDSRRGVIGLASSSDGLHWQYEKIILREPFHLSYPQ